MSHLFSFNLYHLLEFYEEINPSPLKHRTKKSIKKHLEQKQIEA